MASDVRRLIEQTMEKETNEKGRAGKDAAS